MAQKTDGRAEPVHTTTVTVTDLRTDLRKYLELAHYSSRHFVVERNHEPFVMILGIEDYRRLLAAGEGN